MRATSTISTIRATVNSQDGDLHESKPLRYKELHLGGRPFLWYARNRMTKEKWQPEEVHRWEKKRKITAAGIQRLC